MDGFCVGAWWTSAEPVSLPLWGALMLARDVSTLDSILARLPVRAGALDVEAYRRALAGAPLPAPETLVEIGREELLRIEAGGPFKARARR